jgi:hypothetical protein
MDETKQYLAKNGEEYFMKVEDEKFMKEVRDKIVEHIKNGDLKSQSLNQLKKDFNLTVPVLDKIWLEEKEKLPDLAINKHAQKSTQNQPISEQKSTSNNISQETKKESVEKVRDGKKSIFEVVEKKIILKTSNGTYEKTDEGIKFLDKLYKNTDQVKQDKIEILDEYEKRKLQIIKEIQNLENEMSKINGREEIIKVRTQEIIAAFAYEG